MKKEKLLLLLLAIVQVKNLAFSEDIKLGATFINPDYIEIEKLKSTSADFKNSAGKPGGGASVAANFLEAFIEEGTQW